MVFCQFNWCDLLKQAAFKERGGLSTLITCSLLCEAHRVLYPDVISQTSADEGLESQKKGAGVSYANSNGVVACLNRRTGKGEQGRVKEAAGIKKKPRNGNRSSKTDRKSLREKKRDHKVRNEDI